MDNIGKSFALVLILLMATSSLSLLIVKPTDAQTSTPTSVPVPTPSVPEFTIQLVGPPYTQPTTYQLDQTTGQIVANIGYTNEYSAVEVTIKNQPLVFDYSNVHLIGAFGFYYNIQIKPHSSSGDWTDIYQAWNNGYLEPSNSENTTTSISIEGYGFTGTQTDIQVQAMIGQIGRVYNPNAASQIDMYPYEFEGQTSAWSTTQTITVPANTPLSANSPSPTSSLNPPITPTLTPTTTNSTGNLITIPLSTLIAIFAIFLAIIVVLALLLFKRHRKTTSNEK